MRIVECWHVRRRTSREHELRVMLAVSYRIDHAPTDTIDRRDGIVDAKLDTCLRIDRRRVGYGFPLDLARQELGEQHAIVGLPGFASVHNHGQLRITLQKLACEMTTNRTRSDNDNPRFSAQLRSR